jgi:hypothetical protein
MKKNFFSKYHGSIFQFVWSHKSDDFLIYSEKTCFPKKILKINFTI